MYIVGIDPGAKGAVCVYEPLSRYIKFVDLDKTTWEDLVFYLSTCSISHVFVEQVRSLPGMSAKSNFSFGYNIGQLDTALELAGLSPIKVLPKVWQRVVGVSIPSKTNSRDRKLITADRCLELFPDAEIYGPKGGLKDGRSDALLIAHYGYLLTEED